MKMKPLFLCSLAAFALPVMAAAQDGWEGDVSGEAIIVLAPNVQDARGGIEGEQVLYEAGLTLSAEKVLESGLEIGARTTLRLQMDNPARAGFTGRAPVFANLGSPARGAFTGLTTGGAAEDVGPRGRLEAGYIYAKGRYGEVSLGRDTGVASRFYEGAPSVFSHSRAANSYLDPSGLSNVRTRNDLTGPAAKISYTSPRLIGVRFGASFTPEADAEGLDRDPARDITGVDTPVIENAVELAASINRRLPESGVRLRGGAGFSHGSVDAGPGASVRYGDVQTYSIGGEAEFETVTIGASILHSNNGIEGTAADYTAWSIGAQKEAFDLDFSATYGQASDDLTGTDSESWAIGASKRYNDTVKVAAGWQSHSVDQSRTALIPLAAPKETSDGIVVEITLSL